MALFIDIHAIQTLPPSNVNRDDTGAPKSATFGGVPRQRVSSQAWKRAIRKDFQNRLDPAQLGVRTKRVVSRVVARAQEIIEEEGLDASEWPAQRIADLAEAIFKAGKIKVEKPKKGKKAEDDDVDAGEEFAESGYLIFLSNQQITNVARALLENPEEKWTRKSVAPLLDEEHSVDVAAFGRMIADDAAYNVDAAVQVAHAIGVGPSEPEFDYFTAVDDVVQEAEETGAGMIGTVQIMSSTLYRYATINVDGLLKNLGDADVTKQAVDAFLQSFISSMPSGKINTFANHTLPELVNVVVRDDRPVSLVNAFEEPVHGYDAGGRRQETAERLVKEAKDLEKMYGAKPLKSWVLSVSTLEDVVSELGDVTSLEALLGGVQTELDERL